jgi:hypothetical protein
MKKFVNNLNYVPPAGEVNDLPSETQPEMTLSLRELLSRYTRGGEVATFSPVYQDNDEFEETPEFEKMDATEKLQYALDLKMAIKRHQERPVPKVKPEPENKPAPEPVTKPESVGDSGV